MHQRPIPAMDIKSGTMLLLLAAAWGGSFFFAELALVEVPPLTMTLHRVFWAMLTLAVIVYWQGLSIPRSWRIWAAYLMMGALNNAIPFSLIFWGQTQIDSGLASILNATTAMFAAVVAGLLLKDEPLTLHKIAGAGLGVIGVAIIIGPSALSGLSLGSLAQLAILGAALSYAFAGVWEGGEVCLPEDYIEVRDRHQDHSKGGAQHQLAPLLCLHSDWVWGCKYDSALAGADRCELQVIELASTLSLSLFQLCRYGQLLQYFDRLGSKKERYAPSGLTRIGPC